MTADRYSSVRHRLRVRVVDLTPPRRRHSHRIARFRVRRYTANAHPVLDMECRLRQASPSDTGFLFTLLHTIMGDAIEETWGWDEAWQRRNFDARVAQYVVSII